MKANQLTGTDCFEARTHIGLSLSAVSKQTGINRNTLSDFEKEKGTVTVMQKRSLIVFYEERGYDFEEKEPADIETVINTYEETQEQADHLIATLPEEVTSTLEILKDSFNDLVTANQYIERLTAREEEEAQTPDVNYFYVEETNNPVLFKAFDQGHQALITHFNRDKAKETKQDIGWLTSETNRAASLVAMLAIQQLRLMKLHSAPSNTYFDALLSKDKDSEVLGVDGRNLIGVINECLGRSDALELAGFKGLGINEEEEN